MNALFIDVVAVARSSTSPRLIVAVSPARLSFATTEVSVEVEETGAMGCCSAAFGFSRSKKF